MKTWITLIFCLVLFPWLAQSAEYYRWADENGVSHVTDQPPPATGKKIKIYRMQPAAGSVAPQEETTGEVSGSETGGQPPRDDDGEVQNPEQERVQSEYEEAQKYEDAYQKNYRNSYGDPTARKYWRERLEDVENKENDGKGEESDSSVGGETSSPNPPGDQPPM